MKYADGYMPVERPLQGHHHFGRRDHLFRRCEVTPRTRCTPRPSRMAPALNFMRVMAARAMSCRKPARRRSRSREYPAQGSSRRPQVRRSWSAKSRRPGDADQDDRLRRRPHVSRRHYRGRRRHGSALAQIVKAIATEPIARFKCLAEGPSASRAELPEDGRRPARSRRSGGCGRRHGRDGRRRISDAARPLQGRGHLAGGSNIEGARLGRGLGRGTRRLRRGGRRGGPRPRAGRRPARPRAGREGPGGYRGGGAPKHISKGHDAKRKKGKKKIPGRASAGPGMFGGDGLSETSQ